MEHRHAPGGPATTKGLFRLAVPIAISLIAAALLVALAVLFSAHRALTRANRTTSTQGQLAFRLETLDTAANRARNPGFEPVASSPDYTTGAYFDGKLYLAGPDGLTIVAADTSDRRAQPNLRTGIELPVAPIVAMAACRLRGSAEPQLLLATSGAGLLLLEPDPKGSPSIHQLLPFDAEARDLTALLPLATGDLLLATRHRGVLIYDGTSLTPLRFTLPGINPSSLQVTALAAVDAAAFLIGTRDQGVFYLHAGIVDHVNASSGLPDDQVESIAVSPGPAPAHAFVGTPVGTAEFSLAGQSFSPVRTLGQGLFSHALAIGADQLTIGTLDQGIQQVPLDANPHLRRTSISAGQAGASSQRIDALIASPDAPYALAAGTLLRKGGTGPGGTGSGWDPAIPPASTSLADRNISALSFAPDGTLYVGFFDHGLDLVSPQNTIRHLEDDHLFCINRLVLDPERHTIAAATANGLVLFDAEGNPRQTLTRRDGLISDHVTDIAFTPAGTAVATAAGLTFLSPSGAESLYAFQGLVNNHVYALASGVGSDQLLAGTLGGISVLRSNAVDRNFTVANSALKHNWITALLPLSNSTAAAGATTLVGTYGGGLETLDAQGHFTPIELPAGMPRNLVINPNALFATSTHIYAGTLGNGLLVYSTASGRWSAIENGLPSLNVTAFAAHDGEIYIGTQNGLVRIAETSLP